MNVLPSRSFRMLSIVSSLVGAGAALTASGIAAQPAETFGFTLTAAASRPAKPARTVTSLRLGLDNSRAPQVALTPLDNRLLGAQQKAADAGSQRKVLRYAVPRAVSLAAVDGSWTALPDGRRLWVADLVSPNALALRLHLTALALPPGAELAIYAPAQEPLAVSAPPEVRLGSRAERLRSELWTGTVPGERARIEYLAPRGDASEALPFRVDRLLHVYRDLVREAWDAKQAGSCNNDVGCFDELAEVKRAVALILMPDRACTGTLIADLAHDGTPYFLTANHCVFTRAAAADTELVWFYETAACDDEPPSLASLPRSLGATLVSTHPQSDYTLLQVEGALPPNPTFAGWTSAVPEAQTESIAIHHPEADYKRVSFGVVAASANMCQRAFRGNKVVRVDWTDGPTEPGSSGAGIFRGDSLQLFGQLIGGPSACGKETYDCFGSFAATFPRIERFLAAGADDSSEDNDTCRRARRVEPGTLEERVVSANDADWYRIHVPAGKRVTVHVDFVHANGDVELEAMTRCSTSSVVAASASTDDAEEITFQAPRRGRRLSTLYWKVSLDPADTRNTYSIRVTID